MNPIVLQYLDDLRMLLGAYLDKLKVKNPLVFTLISTTVLVGNIAIIFGKLSFGVGYDPYVVAFLSMFNTYISPRTSLENAKYNQRNDSDTNVQRDTNRLRATNTNKHKRSTEAV